MEVNGYMDSLKFIGNLSFCKELYSEGEMLDIRKAYAENLSSATKLLGDTLREENIEKKVSLLFSSEKSAQEYDFEMARSKEAKRDALSALAAIKNIWEQGKHEKFVKKYYAEAHKGITKATQAINTPDMDNLIKSQCRKLGVLANGLTTPAEKAFYLKRQECLKVIAKEHKLQINRHLGLIESDTEQKK